MLNTLLSGFKSGSEFFSKIIAALEASILISGVDIPSMLSLLNEEIDGIFEIRLLFYLLTLTGLSERPSLCL